MTNAQKQFVIQQHTTTDGVHWDLMLEMEDTLWTWRLNIPPTEIKNEPIPAERIHDHPKRFLTYEGPVQNKTGNVTVTDKGIYNLTNKQGDILSIEFHGEILKESYMLSDSLFQRTL